MSTLIRRIFMLLFPVCLILTSLAQQNGFGVLVNKPHVLQGYTFIAPRSNSEAYVIDNDGRVVQEWDLGTNTREIHFLENGNILVVRAPHAELDKSFIDLGYSADGALAEYTWDGELVWEYNFLDPKRRHHHGIDILPNGNILAIVWDYHHIDEALDSGLHPALAATIFDGIEVFLPDTIVEIDKTSSVIVWEWQAWEHLVQDLGESLPDFGLPSARPERVDINYNQYSAKDIPTNWSAGPADWLHSNMVNYNPELDQVIMSVLRFDEFWIMDHDLSREESAGPAGDLLYRWGNPFAFGQGDMVDDRQLYQQHDVQWIDEGLPGAGNVLIYNNRNNVVREEVPAEDEYSSILELKLPLREGGTYDWSADAEIVWQYDQDFYSRFISGVQRLPNGNTLVTEGGPGRLIEVTPDGEVVWEFILSVEPDNNNIFRSRKYAADYPGFDGKDLSPGAYLGE